MNATTFSRPELGSRRAALFKACAGVITLLGTAAVSGPAAAQWTADGADLAGRHKAWRSDPDDPYSPHRSIGASSLAFDQGGSLYLACEKFPVLLVFPSNGSKPRRVHLEGVHETNGEPDVDLEAISICDGNIYLFDEDRLVIYVTPVDHPGAVETLALDPEGPNIDNASLNPNDESDHSSVEGMVVSEELLGATGADSDLGSGPYFYLLDELDDVNGRRAAKLYFGARRGDRIRMSKRVISFVMEDRFRLPELFEHRGELYALRTKLGSYEVRRCNLDAGKLEEVCDFSKFANALVTPETREKCDSNFEGAAVAPDGRLFLTADNESLVQGGKGPPPNRGRRGVTPVISLKPLP